MLEFDTPYHASVRKLKPPTSAAFDLKAWTTAYDQLEEPRESDTTLLASAIWIATQSALLRNMPKDPVLEASDGATAVLLAVAAINYEFLTIHSLSKSSLKEAQAEGAVSFGHIVARTLLGSPVDQRMSADDVLEAGGDAVESWLFDGYAKTEGKPPDDLDFSPVAARGLLRYSMQRGLNNLWNQCYWEGWRLTIASEKVTWLPGDTWLATRLEAGRIRHSENSLNHPIFDMAAWASMKPAARRALTLPRTVVEVTPGRRRKIRMGRPTCLSRQAPQFVIERATLKGSYLNFILDRPLPKEPSLTCQKLVQAWHVLLDLAYKMAVALQAHKQFNWNAVQDIALVLTRSRLVEILADAADIDRNVANTIVTFLTFKPKSDGDKGYRGLWSAPIVAIPGSELVALTLPALAVSNPQRKVEGWLEKGGLDDNLSKDARGNLYEAQFRARIRKAILDNPILNRAVCAENGIKRGADFGEQIDILIRLGSLLIVAEVKCWLFPAESFERFTYLRKLRDAAHQASRKANLMRKRPDVAAKALGLPAEICSQLRVLPLVVANQGFGFSLNIDGCIVTDAAFLETYFSEGRLGTDMVLDTRTGKMMTTVSTLYETETQASEQFEKIFGDSPLLSRFERRIAWTMEPFPSLTGEPVLFAAPRLQDLSGSERLRAEEKLAAFRSA